VRVLASVPAKALDPRILIAVTPAANPWRTPPSHPHASPCSLDQEKGPAELRAWAGLRFCHVCRRLEVAHRFSQGKIIARAL